jgi:putative heme-binding domain-containing protein
MISTLSAVSTTRLSLVSLALFGVHSPAGPPPAGSPLQNEADTTPKWVWLDETSAHEEVIFRRTFHLESAPEHGKITATCDNYMTVLVNGTRMGAHREWQKLATADIAPALRSGENTVEVRARNNGGPAALILELEIPGRPTIVSDHQWDAAPAQYAEIERFGKATELGVLGAPELPWSTTVTKASFDGPCVQLVLGEPDALQEAKAADSVRVPKGFHAELLYEVPNELFGSWVSLTTDHQGRLYASDQAGRGLFRITPAPIGDASAKTKVERVDVEISGAQGLLWAFDSLYVNVFGKGLFRLKDTDGDDQLDEAEHLVALGFGSEHGPHAVHLSKDGKGLYFIGGNLVGVPEFQGSRAPDNWGEDLLLPRLWDPNGHARGIYAPGGWIARCNPDGSNVEIISSGYRNQYDISLNPEGEMFTYDADMEWDQGMPWYRPTRVCHATSGSEFGWRGGTGKWPPYYEDSLPPVLEIGPGSPTGVVFGTGTRFPEPYQSAFFILDWTFGTIYAVHLEPEGASYRARKEEFAWSKPLGVTDITVGADGAFYFTVGGRGAQSALYRIYYDGMGPEGEPLEAASEPLAAAVDAEAAAMRQQRRELEAFHGQPDAEAVQTAWPFLDSSDRFLRFAARIAVENQPVAEWRQRALDERSGWGGVAALIALARQGGPDDLPKVVEALSHHWQQPLEPAQKLGVLRGFALAFVRLGAPDEELAAGVLALLEPAFPADSADGLGQSTPSRSVDALNVELARLLVYLDSSVVVPRTLNLMAIGEPVELPPWADLIERNDSYGGPIAAMLANMPPTQNIQFALFLVWAKKGWTLPLRRQYFEFFSEAAQHPGGASYAGFLENIRSEAAKSLSVTEERSLAAVIGQPLVASLPEDVQPPAGPGREWTHSGAVAALGSELKGANFEWGQNLYHALSCSQCHRFAGAGGAIGPDLSTVGNKFSVGDILESIIEPNKIISDQYGSHIVVDTDGMVEEGILVDEGDVLVLYPRDASQDPFVYERSDIKLIKESPTSQMPAGLVDPLSAEELRDLLAFLVSGGNESDPMFSSEAAEGVKDKR